MTHPVLSDDDSLLNFTVADFAAYYGGGGPGPGPDPQPPTGATPGGWTPAGSEVPPTGPPTVPASPATAWTEGQSVTTGDGQKWYWDGSAWQSGTAPAPTPPDPHIDSIAPNTGVVGTEVTITITGSNFESDSTVEINGTAVATTFVSATQLTVTVTPQTAAIAQVSVRNSSGMESNDVPLVVAPPVSPTPVLTSLDPGTAVAGSGALTIRFLGSDFAADAYVSRGGVNEPTTFVSDTELTIQYNPAVAGTLQFQVFNPGSMNGSDVLDFVIT